MYFKFILLCLCLSYAIATEDYDCITKAKIGHNYCTVAFVNSDVFVTLQDCINKGSSIFIDNNEITDYVHTDHQKTNIGYVKLNKFKYNCSSYFNINTNEQYKTMYSVEMRVCGYNSDLYMDDTSNTITCKDHNIHPYNNGFFHITASSSFPKDGSIIFSIEDRNIYGIVYDNYHKHNTVQFYKVIAHQFRRWYSSYIDYNSKDYNCIAKITFENHKSCTGTFMAENVFITASSCYYLDKPSIFINGYEIKNYSFNIMPKHIGIFTFKNFSYKCYSYFRIHPLVKYYPTIKLCNYCLDGLKISKDICYGCNTFNSSKDLIHNEFRYFPNSNYINPMRGSPILVDDNIYGIVVDYDTDYIYYETILKPEVVNSSTTLLLTTISSTRSTTTLMADSTSQSTPVYPNILPLTTIGFHNFTEPISNSSSTILNNNKWYLMLVALKFFY